MRKLLALPGALLFFVMSGFAAQAQPVAGKAIDSKPAARKVNAELSVVIVTGTAVAMGDRITTDAAGLVHLIFSDQTKLVVGPRSSLVIESYLLRSRSTANSFTVRALGGSFRMFTGNSNKRAYSIKTPTATIGVRGTSFDLSVQRNGATRVVLFDGAARVCGNNGQCEVLNRPCAMAEAAPRQDVEVVEDDQTRLARLRQDFPFIVSQSPLRSEFRVSLRGCPSAKPPDDRINPPVQRIREINDRVIIEPAPTEPGLGVSITAGNGGSNIDIGPAPTPTGGSSVSVTAGGTTVTAGGTPGAIEGGLSISSGGGVQAGNSANANASDIRDSVRSTVDSIIGR